MTAALNSWIRLDEETQDLLFRQARSSTEFTDEPVDDEQLRAIYDLFKYCPTSFNGQPLRIVAVRSEQARATLLPHLHGRNRSRVANCPLVLILAADMTFHEHLPEVFAHAPLIHQRFAESAEERIGQAWYNAILQIGFLVLAIRAVGLAAGPIQGFDHEAVNRKFFPDGRLQALLVMNVGHGLPKRYDRLPRLSYEDVVSVV
jgi:3-hydroxypropanoate dehydrogenase